MENIAGVTGHLKKKVIEKGGDLEREVLNLIPTKEGKAYLTDENGECWRAYIFITDAIMTQMSEIELQITTDYLKRTFCYCCGKQETEPL